MLQALHSPIEPLVLKDRLLELWERTNDPALGRLAAGESPIEGEPPPQGQDLSDWVSTCLMNAYKQSGDPQVFGLLFELNRAAFLIAVQGKLRGSPIHLDPQDVLQEVFLNIYRYPHRFLADRADAFRNWGHRIVRNTLLKFLKGESRTGRHLALEDEIPLPEDVHARSPERAAVESESAQTVNHAYLLYLNLYLMHFQRLSEKERRALTLVEVEGISYKDAAADLCIRLENLKMVIFRGRRKIFRGMAQSLEYLGASHHRT
jgi:RNA polymerase sigma-70 factor, ECF subfamily